MSVRDIAKNRGARGDSSFTLGRVRPSSENPTASAVGSVKEKCAEAYRKPGDRSVHCRAVAAKPGAKWDYCLTQYQCRVSGRMEAKPEQCTITMRNAQCVMRNLEQVREVVLKFESGSVSEGANAGRAGNLPGSGIAHCAFRIAH